MRRDGRLVMQAILLGGPNLLRSFVLGLIVIVCFGFYSYAYFSQSVNIEQQLCHSPFQVILPRENWPENHARSRSKTHLILRTEIPGSVPKSLS